MLASQSFGKTPAARRDLRTQSHLVAAETNAPAASLTPRASSAGGALTVVFRPLTLLVGARAPSTWLWTTHSATPPIRAANTARNADFTRIPRVRSHTRQLRTRVRETRSASRPSRCRTGPCLRDDANRFSRLRCHSRRQESTAPGHPPCPRHSSKCLGFFGLGRDARAFRRRPRPRCVGRTLCNPHVKDEHPCFRSATGGCGAANLVGSAILAAGGPRVSRHVEARFGTLTRHGALHCPLRGRFERDTSGTPSPASRAAPPLRESRRALRVETVSAAAS